MPSGSGFVDGVGLGLVEVGVGVASFLAAGCFGILAAARRGDDGREDEDEGPGEAGRGVAGVLLLGQPIEKWPEPPQ